MRLSSPELDCGTCQRYADLAARWCPKPCQGCPLYAAPKLMPATDYAINLYWLVNGDKIAREQYKRTKYRMPEWLADYTFEVWAIYDKVVSEVKTQREGVTDVNSTD